MDFSNYWWQAAEAPAPSGDGKSLRFRNNQFLNRNAVTPTEGRKFTLSFWLKSSPRSDDDGILVSSRSWPPSTGDECRIRRTSVSGNIVLNFDIDSSSAGGNNAAKNGSRAVRDASAWYHVVYKFDSTLGTGSQRLVLFYNNLADSLSGADIAANSIPAIQAAGSRMELGVAQFRSGTRVFLDGYLAEVNFIDGQALDPTEFGEYDANGVWVPKGYAGAYGNNGFYLDFSDPANIGADRSSNGNNWTPNSFELADQTSTDWDHMEDHPTQNFATLNPLQVTGINSGGNPVGRVIQDANLAQTQVFQSGALFTPSTIASTEPFYAEFGPKSGGAEFGVEVGVTDDDSDGSIDATGVPGGRTTSAGFMFYVNSKILVNGIAPYGTNIGIPFNDGDLFQVAVNGDNIYFAINNSWIIDTGTSYQLNGAFDAAQPTCVLPHADPLVATGMGDSMCPVNYGQRPFAFELPDGFKTLQTQNLPAAPIPSGRDHFQAITDTGANILTAAQTAFPNSLIWIKDRPNENQHQFVDSVRGGNLAWTTPNNQLPIAYAAPTGNSVAWCWNFNAADPSINGFEILTYSGDSDSNRNITHNLGGPADMYWTKAITSQARNTVVYMPEFLGSSATGLNSISLNGNGAPFATSANNPTNNTVGVGDGSTSNVAGADYVMYLWRAIPGYSAFGSYSGNGDPDGPFIYTGFRPAFVMFKRTDDAGNWIMYDSTRDLVNVVANNLAANMISDEDRDEAWGVDFLANGLKLRTSHRYFNESAGKYVYICFAETPFGGNNVSPANAR